MSEEDVVSIMAALIFASIPVQERRIADEERVAQDAWDIRKAVRAEKLRRDPPDMSNDPRSQETQP